MITEQRKAELQALGYYVEDMGEEYGVDFAGQFRFMNDKTGDFQDWCTSDSEADAWVCCDKGVHDQALNTLDPYERHEIHELMSAGKPGAGQARVEQLVLAAKQRFAAQVGASA